MLQLGVYVQELATALCSAGVVAVSENTRRDNPFVRRVIPHGVDDRFFSEAGMSGARSPRCCLSARSTGASGDGFLLDGVPADGARRASHRDARLRRSAGPAAPGVTYHTGISDEALAGLYHRAWVYASPSTYEGFGLPYLEAMACGTPVVASPNPGSAEVLDDGRCGVLAADDAFDHEVAALLGDTARRRELSACGLTRARESSLSRMLGNYEELLFELTEVHAGSPPASDALAYGAVPAPWWPGRSPRPLPTATAGAGSRSSSRSSCCGARRSSCPARRPTAL